MIVILVILLMLGVPVILVVVIVAYLSRKSSAAPPPLPNRSSTSDRLRQLEDLKQQKLVSDAEYEEQRRRIISET